MNPRVWIAVDVFLVVAIVYGLLRRGSGASPISLNYGGDPNLHRALVEQARATRSVGDLPRPWSSNSSHRPKRAAASSSSNRTAKRRKKRRKRLHKKKLRNGGSGNGTTTADAVAPAR